MKKSLIIGLSALALATGGAAYAKHHGHGMSADADGNGLVTRAEAEAGAAAKFAKIDANNDGAITPADHEARMTEMRTRMFAAIDADKSGQISRDEFMNHKHEGGHGGMHGGKGMGHKMGENVISVHYIQTHQSDPRGDGIFRYSLQKLYNDEATRRLIGTNQALKFDDKIFKSYKFGVRRKK